MRRRLLPLLAVCLCTGGLTAQEGTLQKLGPPPGSLPEELRTRLAPEGTRVEAGGRAMNFWFASRIGTGEPQQGLGIAFPQFEVSTLVGVVDLEQEWSDYKGKPVPAGLYTLRYGVQPADGDHTGVSLYRDFVLLSPVLDDPDPDASFGMENLIDLSTRASGTPHPAVMALFPVWDEMQQPALVLNDMEQTTLAVPFAEVTLGLVVIGQGELEGY